MPAIVVHNLLVPDFAGRDALERTVQAAFENLTGGPWTVTLKHQDSTRERVAVEVRSPRTVLLTSFDRAATPDEITSRMKLLSVPSFQR